MAAILDLTPTRSRFFTSSTMLYLLLLFAERFRSGFKAVSKRFHDGFKAVQGGFRALAGIRSVRSEQFFSAFSWAVPERFQSGFRAVSEQ